MRSLLLIWIATGPLTASQNRHLYPFLITEALNRKIHKFRQKCPRHTLADLKALEGAHHWFKKHPNHRKKVK